MTQKELICKIKAEIERLKKRNKDEFAKEGLFEVQDNLNRLLSFIESMEQSIDGMISLGKAAAVYAEHNTCYNNDWYMQRKTTRDAFKAGAKWRDAQILKLPDNLDEAAEEFAWKKEEPLADGERLSSAFNPRIDAFKAGAKWMAEQYKTLGETEIYLEDDGGEAPYTQEWLDLATTEFAIPYGFKPGDKVIVQIRKKEV